MLKTSLLLSLIFLSTTASALSLQSKSFPDNSTIPAAYSCDGKDSSPELNWSGAPAETKAFALIVSDPDAAAGTWIHWVAYNIPATVSELPKAQALPAGAVAGQNSFAKNQYNGPCPPKGSNPHHYIFTLYALDQHLNLAAGADAKAVEAAMQDHVLAKASLLGLFAH